MRARARREIVYANDRSATYVGFRNRIKKYKIITPSFHVAVPNFWAHLPPATPVPVPIVRRGDRFSCVSKVPFRFDSPYCRVFPRPRRYFIHYLLRFVTARRRKSAVSQAIASHPTTTVAATTVSRVDVKKKLAPTLYHAIHRLFCRTYYFSAITNGTFFRTAGSISVFFSVRFQKPNTYAALSPRTTLCEHLYTSVGAAAGEKPRRCLVRRNNINTNYRKNKKSRALPACITAARTTCTRRMMRDRCGVQLQPRAFA